MSRSLNATGRRRRRSLLAVVGALGALALAVAVPAGDALAAVPATTTGHTAPADAGTAAAKTTAPKTAARTTHGKAASAATAASHAATAQHPDRHARISAAALRAQRAKAAANAARTADDIQTGDCGGAVTLGSVYACDSITDGGSDIYTVTTTGAHDLLTVQLTADDGVAVYAGLTAPDGSPVYCPVNSSTGPGTCATDAAGTYTLTVEDQYGTGGYALSVSSLRDADCPDLTAADLAFGAAPVTGDITAGGASACYDLAPGTATTGDLVRMSGLSYELQSYVYTGDSTDPVCDLGQYGETCTLSGTGPYRVVFRDTYGAAISYDVGITRLSHPDGCDTLAAAPFGDPGPAVMSGTLAVDAAQCRTVTLSAGAAAVAEQHGGSSSGSTDWTLYTADGTSVCSGNDDSTCDNLPGAGTYTLVADNSHGYVPTDYALSVVPLTTTDGCAASAGTGYDQPLLHASLTSPLQIDCRPFTAAPGDRVDVTASPDVYAQLVTTVVDASGTPSCTADPGEQDGCVLTGSGPYRVLVRSLYDVTVDYTMRVARLSEPAGCTELAPQTYGTVPTPSTDPCRTVHVPAAGTYDTGGTKVYNTDGTRACTLNGTRCTLTAAGTYELVNRPSYLDDTPFSPVFIDVTRTGGCVAASDSGFADGPATGDITGPGETDCLTLPTASGAGLYLVNPGDDGLLDADVHVVDATGTEQCDAEDYTLSVCQLTGTAPFRVLVRAASDPVGHWSLTVARTDDADGCTDFPESPFGNSYGATATLTAGTPFTCLSIGAGEHGTSELFDYTNDTNSMTGSAVIADAGGRTLCQTLVSSSMYCPLTTGTAYTEVLIAHPDTGTYHLVHRDVDATAHCTDAASTTIGGRPSRGTLDSALATACVRVPAASAADHLWLSTAATGSATQLFVTDATGKPVCNVTGYPCHVSGSTSYQAVITANNYAGTPISYRLDSWQLTNNGAFPAQCPALTAGPAGTGPFSGTLTADHPAYCATIPVRPGEQLTVNGITGAGSGGGVQVHLYDTGTTDMCWGSGGDTAQCSVPYGYQASTALAVVNLPPSSDHEAFTLWAACTSQCPAPSAGAPVLTAVTPAHAPAGTTASVTLTGTGLATGDTVWLTRSGTAPLRGTVTGVTGGATALAAFDLHTAQTGTWDVWMTAPTGAATSLPGAFTVDPAPQPSAHRTDPSTTPHTPRPLS